MNLEQGLAIADEAVFDHAGRRLSEVELLVLQGYWEDQTHEAIAQASGYSLSYRQSRS